MYSRNYYRLIISNLDKKETLFSINFIFKFISNFYFTHFIYFFHYFQYEKYFFTFSQKEVYRRSPWKFILRASKSERFEKKGGRLLLVTLLTDKIFSNYLTRIDFTSNSSSFSFLKPFLGR